MVRVRKRLGIYVDGPYRAVRTPAGLRVAPDPADFPFLTFACEVGRRFDATVVFGRARRTDDPEGRLLLPEAVTIVELPYYEHLRDVGAVARAGAGTMRGFWRGLSEVDAIWVFGPHPFSLVLATLALARRKRVVLGVRQDTVAYFDRRLPNERWRPTLLGARALDASFRALARATGVTVVGDELARRYGTDAGRLLPITVSLVRDEDLVAHARERDWDGTIRLFTAGRIDQEKNPLLLVEALAALERERPGRYRLAWAGEGPLRDAVRTRAEELGLGDRVELLGFVRFGDELLDRYRGAHMFVHVSLTEGVPAVLAEAAASGTPIVATAVGGVPSALRNGEAGLLVPPDDREALVQAILRLSDDAALRSRLTEQALTLARGWTLDTQADRVARFIGGSAGEGSGAG